MTPASHREQLTALLCEAAEIEHCLMCTYLYAAFSLKQDADEGLLPQQLDAVRRWRAEIVRIATDEMLHLALVNNLLIALGAPPHYRRFNFPINPGMFPADVAVALARFDADTLDHFVYLERPLQAQEHDAEAIAKPQYERHAPAGRLSAFAEDYRTVGELYEAIEESFAQLVAAHGEAEVFIGPKSSQLTEREFRLAGLHAVQSLDDVRSAVGLIRHQGEGSPADVAGSHYARFCAVREEWRALSADDPAFEPARPAAHDPVMRSPVARERVHVTAEPAAALLDAGNAAYALMVQQLALLSDDDACIAGLRRPLAEQSLALMHLIADAGSALTRLPASDAHPGVTAGLTFTVSRASHGYPALAVAAEVLAERFALIAARLRELASALPALARHAAVLEGFAIFWQGERERLGSRAQAANAAASAVLGAAAPPPPPVPMPVPASTSRPAPSTPTPDAAPASAPPKNSSSAAAATGEAPPSPTDAPDPQAASAADLDPAREAPPAVEIARGQAAEIHFEAKRCIHSRHCVLQAPQVFLANTPGEWLKPDAASAEHLLRVALDCPSGAIRLRRLDGGEAERPPSVNVLRVRENGPLAVHADLRLPGREAETRATLCRCGQSRNKPYCDGSHAGAEFTASGEPATREFEPLTVRDGPLQVTPLRDGPYEVSGNLELCAGTGRTVDRLTSVRLCRCGQSGNKPFCDGSHAPTGFVADGS